MKVFRTYGIVLLCMLYASTFAQTYNFKNYNTEDGLPQSQVLCIFQDSKGYLWFGTNSGGAGRFDGNKFEQFDINDGLINNVVYSIIETPQHEIVFGTEKGVSVMKNGAITNYSQKNGLSNSYVYRLLYHDNKIWICTQNGVFTLKDGKIMPFILNETLNQSAVYNMFVDSKGSLWFATMQNGAIYYDPKNNSFKQFNSKNGIQNDFIFCFNERDNGDILVGTQTGLNIISKDFAVSSATYVPAQENVSFTSILKKNGDIFYFGTFYEGVYSFDFTKKVANESYNGSNGLTNNNILALLKDREDNMWVGTNGSGTYKYQSPKFTYFSKNNGLSENYINDVAEDGAGNIWLALNTDGLVKITGKTITPYKRDFKNNKALKDNNITTILPLRDGSLYFGTDEGIYHFKNEEFAKLSDPLIKDKYIHTLYVDTENTLWIGTNVGVYKMHNGVVSEEKEINKLIDNGANIIIPFILKDKYDRLLVGTENGLVQYDKGKITLYNEKNKFINARITCAAVDHRKNIWLGTADGMFLYQNGSFTKISKKDNFTNGFIYFLEIDTANNLYIGSNNGIDILNIDGFYKNKINFKHFGKNDGLLSLESNSNACFLSKKGKLMVGTVAGLEIYDPAFDSQNRKEAVLNITGVSLFFGLEDPLKYSSGIDSSTALPKELVLPYSKNNLTFKYIGVSLSVPEKVRYKYKLEGLDETWTPENSKTEVTYPSLPPGTYTFMVISMNNDGLWNMEPATYTFRIMPPWYQTWWFYTLCVVALGTGIFAYNTIKTKKLVADKAKLEKQVDERTKEVVKQKEEIQHKNEEITDSIKYAKNIQEALLPSLHKTEQTLGDCFILYLPKDIVSGDFFWHSDHNNTQFIAAADCTGHGVPGAFMSIVGNNLLNEIINQKNISEPGKILLELHKGVKEALNQNNSESQRRDGMDIALCAIRKKRGTLEYAGANRPLWIYRKEKNELEIIKATKYPIGGLELEETRIYANHTVEVKTGDVVFIFSDGFADQFGGPRGKKFMLSSMQKLLMENIDLPMNTQKANIQKAFKDWKSSLEQVDDVLVIGIRI